MANLLTKCKPLAPPDKGPRKGTSPVGKYNLHPPPREFLKAFQKLRKEPKRKSQTHFIGLVTSAFRSLTKHTKRALWIPSCERHEGYWFYPNGFESSSPQVAVHTPKQGQTNSAERRAAKRIHLMSTYLHSDSKSQYDPNHPRFIQRRPLSKVVPKNFHPDTTPQTLKSARERVSRKKQARKQRRTNVAAPTKVTPEERAEKRRLQRTADRLKILTEQPHILVPHKRLTPEQWADRDTYRIKYPKIWKKVAVENWFECPKGHSTQRSTGLSHIFKRVQERRKVIRNYHQCSIDDCSRC